MGLHYYGMNYSFYIPAGASGVFNITLSDDPNETFIKNPMAEDIPITEIIPSNITVLECSAASDCNDGDACTDNFCISNHCLVQDNVPSGSCCNSNTGELTVIDDDVVCTVDTCLPDGSVTHENPPEIPFCADAVSNRYIQFEPECCDDDSMVAFRVSGDIDFTFADLGYIQADGSIGPLPHYESLLTWQPSLVSGPLIRPGTTYRITSETQDQSPPHDEFLEMTTSKFGDVDENGIASLSDVYAIGGTFSGIFDHPLEVVDIAPCVPNGIVNLADVFWAAFGFQLVPFEQLCPTGACCNGETCSDYDWFGMYESECDGTWVEGEICMMSPCD